jgi:signal transduction histidine kinase
MRVNAQPPTNIDIKEILRPVFFGLSEDDLDELAAAAVARTFGAGDVICAEGEPGSTFFVIVFGRVEMLKHMSDATVKFLHDSGPGEFFGEMAIVQEGARSATVRAVEPTTLLEIGQQPFLSVLGRSPSLAIRILVQMTGRLRDADQQAIAELRRANEELQRALQRLGRLDRTKSDFIQISAHELRTPVAALKGYAQMMEAHPAVGAASDLSGLVRGVTSATERLRRVFDGILDMSRVIDGDLVIHRSPVSLRVIFHGIATHFADAITQRGLTLDTDGLDELPFCPADPELIYKAFRHLVNNAIKYTPDGGRIAVVGRTTTVPGLGPCIEVLVEDSGIGIAPEDLALIFEKFYRTGEVAFHSSGTVAFKGGGPGLGLAIARGVVVAHGGRIWAESPGYDEETCPGSRFFVQLPLGEKE